jgi:hypothetical protein
MGKRNDFEDPWCAFGVRSSLLRMNRDFGWLWISHSRPLEVTDQLGRAGNEYVLGESRFANYELVVDQNPST